AALGLAGPAGFAAAAGAGAGALVAGAAASLWAVRALSRYGVARAGRALHKLLLHVDAELRAGPAFPSRSAPGGAAGARPGLPSAGAVHLQDPGTPAPGTPGPRRDTMTRRVEKSEEPWRAEREPEEYPLHRGDGAAPPLTGPQLDRKPR